MGALLDAAVMRALLAAAAIGALWEHQQVPLKEITRALFLGALADSVSFEERMAFAVSDVLFVISLATVSEEICFDLTTISSLRQYILWKTALQVLRSHHLEGMEIT